MHPAGTYPHCAARAYSNGHSYGYGHSGSDTHTVVTAGCHAYTYGDSLAASYTYAHAPAQPTSQCGGDGREHQGPARRGCVQ